MTNPVMKRPNLVSSEISRSEQLPQALHLSLEMLRNAISHNWDMVISLESNRNELISDFFSTSVSADEASIVADYIRKILDVDKQLIELGDNECKLLKGNLQKVTHGKRALKVYSSV
jgi:hypothetical protein